MKASSIGETAVVTGGAGGIGRAIVEELAGAGYRVVVADVDSESGAELASELRHRGLEVGFLRIDLASRAKVDRAVERLREAYGPVHVLVNNAAPRRRESEHAMAVTTDEWDRMLGVVLTGAFHLTQQIARHMVADGTHGRIVFITSLHAREPRNLVHYSAAKAGLTMVMRELARALAPRGIRVNAVAPGAIPTGGTTASAALGPKIPLGRPGRPDEVATVVRALVDDHLFGYVTGTTIDVDGGLALYNWIDPAPGQ